MQNRVLSYGIAGAIVFRLSIILLGSVTLQVISPHMDAYINTHKDAKNFFL